MDYAYVGKLNSYQKFSMNCYNAGSGAALDPPLTRPSCNMQQWIYINDETALSHPNPPPRPNLCASSAKVSLNRKANETMRGTVLFFSIFSPSQPVCNFNAYARSFHLTIVAPPQDPVFHSQPIASRPGDACASLAPRVAIWTALANFTTMHISDSESEIMSRNFWQTFKVDGFHSIPNHTHWRCIHLRARRRLFWQLITKLIAI